MPKPVCPNCRSTNVVASLAKNSHNNCVSCGHTDYVATFYPEHHTYRSPPVQVEDPGEDTMVAHAQRTRKPYWWERD